MGRDYFLDKDIVIDREGNIYMVYSNVNPYGYIYAMLKYVYTGKGLWRGYERALKYYGVHNVLKLNQEFLLEPCQGVSFPVLRTSQISKHLKPEEKTLEIIKHPNSKQHLAFLKIYEALNVSSVGVTGSLLADIYHENSDVDIVVYGCKEALDVMNNFSGFEEDSEWVIETVRNYKLPLDIVKSLYDKRTRGIVDGVKYSILFVNPRPQRPCEEVCKRVGEVTIEADIESCCEALFYPSKVYLHNVRSSSSIKPELLISYEGIYSTLLFKAKRIEAKGMLVQCDRPIIVIGDRDVPGYVRRIL